MAYGKNTKKAPQRETTPPALIAWHVAERGEKKLWNRIGAAWEHEDGEGLTCNSIFSWLQAAGSFSGRRSKRRKGLNSPFFLSASPEPGAGLWPFLVVQPLEGQPPPVAIPPARHPPQSVQTLFIPFGHGSRRTTPLPYSGASRSAGITHRKCRAYRPQRDR
jgi:hypothetical protein